MNDLVKIKTWDEAVNSGKREGDTLVCVAISVKNKSKVPVQSARGRIYGAGKNPRIIVQRTDLRGKQKSKMQVKIQKLARKYIKEYVESGKDHVLAFHRRPKGGLEGARVWKILENGRPEDEDAMGYNVLMKYPNLEGVKKIKFSENGKPSVLLIEKALDFALKNGIKNVIAFSRPAGFREYLRDK